MTTLTDFLLARIAEDEAVARDLIAEGPWAEFHRDDRQGPSRDDEHSALTVGAGWVMADCRAKRQILGQHERQPDHTCLICRTDWPCATSAILATVYSGHPDYRDEWRP